MRVKRRGPTAAVALVITLILISVITFMAITFLVVSRAQKGAVSTTTDQTTAKLAADAGFERAKAELLAPILAFTNPAGYDLRVSTNYVNPAGFIISGVAYTSFTNASYNYPNGQPLTGKDALQNLANLLYDPRPPVFVTNRLFPNSNEFRFYLDLNRNGRYDTNGLLPVINPNGGFYDTNGNFISAISPGNTASNFFVGDPEWIGGLEKAHSPHSATNRFLYRHAYIAIPAGKTLDINYIHNQAKEPSNPSLEGFLRNQGAGTYEGNLAAFLVDLNTNLWPPQGSPGGLGYFYNTDPAQQSTGAAFQDALWLLRYRYQGNWKTLKTVRQLFGNIGEYSFNNDLVDGYVGWPLMLGTTSPTNDLDNLNNRDKPGRFGWSGADNINHFFTTQEFFDKTKTSIGFPSLFGFTDRLRIAGATNDSYNRYTFYRMLAQLGTDSQSEPSDRMNLNYDNLVRRNPQGVASATNFYAWEPVTFFTNAAIRMLLKAGYTVGNIPTKVGNIPTNILILTTNSLLGGVTTNIQIQIWPTNFYTPSVHRLFQLAANMYDATTNRNPVLAGTNLLALPSVFRPLFRYIPTGDQLFITGYAEVTNRDILSALPHDLLNRNDRPIKPNDMVYGVPLVVGAKKGFPNFNELAMETHIQVTRKLEFRRINSFTEKFQGETNQMYVVGISNVFGVEAWNSYSNAFPRDLQMIVAANMDAAVTTNAAATNSLGTDNLLTPPAPAVVATNFGTNIPVIPANTWAGFDAKHPQVSFRVPFHPSTHGFAFLTNSTYSQKLRHFVPLASIFEKHPEARFAVPHWWLKVRTRLRFILVDTQANRIVDYVNLDSLGTPVDLTDALMHDGQCGAPTAPYNPPDPVPDGALWCTNRGAGVISESAPTYGVRAQIDICLRRFQPQNWPSFLQQLPPGLDRDGAIAFFKTNLLSESDNKYPGPLFMTNTFYAPLAPTRDIYYYTSWQANDPLVHYTIGDLTDLTTTNQVEFKIPQHSPIPNLGQINSRYEPWGSLWNPAHSSSKTSFELAVKDPLVHRSDDWDFPAYKFANVGWLGRVHRGTPWQTVYLKARGATLDQWATWSGNGQFTTNGGQISTAVLGLYGVTNGVVYGVTNDAVFTHPWKDRDVLDLFSTAFNENSARGRLSVNQTNLAAWSAILSGVQVLTNINDDATVDNLRADSPALPFRALPVDPAGVYVRAAPSPLARIVNAINDVRRTNFINGAFGQLGDILAVPELTERSPFLNITNDLQKQKAINDAAYERIPQQVLGLLQGDDHPRFVIYSFGQALKPADHSLVTSGPYFGLCTNYQVVAEVATRAVVRIDLGSPPNNPTNTPRAVVESYNVLPPD